MSHVEFRAYHLAEHTTVSPEALVRMIGNPLRVTMHGKSHEATIVNARVEDGWLLVTVDDPELAAAVAPPRDHDYSFGPVSTRVVSDPRGTVEGP